VRSQVGLRLFAAVVLLLSLTQLHSAASAANYDLGTLPLPYAQPIVGGTLGWPGSTHVLDTYQFKVPSPSQLTTGAIDIVIWPFVNFANLTVDLLDSAHSDLVVATASGSNGFLLSYANLVASSTYKLRITGVLGGAWNFAGIYKGFLAVAAVPLPPAFLLFGSALFGAAAFARRRSAKQASA
jgi:hypothetical protein